jgi:hypothetical protein
MGSDQEYLCLHKSCFAHVVITNEPNGRDIQIRTPVSKLKYGSLVLAMDSEGHLIYSPIVAFVGIFPDAIGNTTTIVLEDESEVITSDHHLVYTTRTLTNFETYESKNLTEYQRACDVRRGHLMHVMDLRDEQNLIKQKRVRKVIYGLKEGFYAPLTQAGTIVINNAVLSCFATHNGHTTHEVIKKSYWPLYKYLKWMPSKDGLSIDTNDSEYWFYDNLKNGLVGHTYESFVHRWNQ